MVPSLWTHSYSYYVLVCTVNSHKKWCHYGTFKNVQSEKNVLALESQPLFLDAISSVPIQVPPASKPTSIDFFPISRPEAGAKQLLSLNRTPNVRWQNGFASLFESFSWILSGLQSVLWHYSFWSHLKTRSYELVIGRILEYIIYFIVSGIWYKQMSSKIWL